MNARVVTGILATLILSTTIVSEKTNITPYFGIRSQGLNAPRHLVGAIQQVYTVDRNALYGTLAVALEYSRSFDHEKITQCLFGTKDCPTVTISGSQVADRDACDWLADYFYLPTDFKSTLNFKPVIDNVLLDFNFYISLDDWTDGLYVALYAPLTHSRWDLNFCETVEMKGTNSHAPGYFTPNTLQRKELLNNFEEYVNGCVIGPFTQTIGSTTTVPPVTFQRLRNARIASTSLNQTRLADIRFEFGYHPLHNPDYHLGFSIYNALPTGNRPEGEFLFEPIIGNGHHWELGGTVNAHYRFYASEDESKQIILYGNAIIDHLFSARQERTFDLVKKPFSRYMLIERLGTPITGNLQGSGTVPSAQFVNEFLPVANLTNLRVDVSATIQTELTALLTFVCNRFSWDIGYDFWYRSCEKLNQRGFNPLENNTKWALKGDAHVFGYDRGAAGAGPLVGAVALSGTESTATINSGTNFTSNTTVAQGIKNPGIDNPKNGSGDASGGAANNPLSAAPFSNEITIQTSIDPIFLTGSSVNVCERVTRGMSSKFFTHFSYLWKDREQWKPYIGIGGQVEFNHNGNECADDCDSCMTCAISQWGVWFKGGMTF